MKKSNKIILPILILLLLGITALRISHSKKQMAATPSTQPIAIEPSFEPAPPSPDPTFEPTPEPVKEFHLSFAGDTTLGSLIEWQGRTGGDFQSTVGQNFAYPLQNVKSIFAADDFTMVNLEGTFTNSNLAVEKKYRFKASPDYAQILQEGCVEAVALANNHAGDLSQQGREDTKASVENVGVQWADANAPLFYTLPDGPKLGIVNYNTVEDYNGEAKWRADIQADIQQCKEAGCDFIIGFMHWGSVEYLPQAETWAVQLAHDMVDWGCQLIVGGHAHILQPMESYNGVPIFYSMGNFCYGGHLNPQDKDSVIVTATLQWENGIASLVNVEPLPCSVSNRTDKNDYCPTLYTQGGDGWQRVMEKLKWSE